MAPSLNPDDIPEALDIQEFWEIFGRIEHEELDFKRGVADSILETIPAMAMTSGGIIVHGVTNDRDIVGCPKSQKTVDRITQRAYECGVEVQIQSITVEEKELTITTVPEIRGRVVTTPDGRLLRRVGGNCLPLRGDAHGWFVRDRIETSGEDEFIDGFAPSDLSLSFLNLALKADGRSSVGPDQALRALADLGVASAESPSLHAKVRRAAVILFAKDPGRFIPRGTVQLVAGLVVFLLLIGLGNSYLAIEPAIRERKLSRAVKNSLVLGCAAYATYIVPTHLAIANWPGILIPIDILIGGLLSVITSTVVTSISLRRLSGQPS